MALMLVEQQMFPTVEHRHRLRFLKEYVIGKNLQKWSRGSDGSIPYGMKIPPIAGIHVLEGSGGGITWGMEYSSMYSSCWNVFDSNWGAAAAATAGVCRDFMSVIYEMLC